MSLALIEFGITDEVFLLACKTKVLKLQIL